MVDKTVLITGGGGAIGCHVIAYLLEQTDWKIMATDSFKSDHKGYFDRIAYVAKKAGEKAKRLTVFIHDLNAPFTEREIKDIGHIDYVINLASRSDVQNSIEDPLPFVRNNTELMLNMLEYARIVKPAVFLHFSTDEVYGAIEEKLLGKSGHKEWSSIVPSNPYSASKALQEALAIAWWRSYGIPLIITNTMNNFGEMQAPSKFPAMIQKKLELNEPITVHAANGEVGSRYYIHSRNTADAILFILLNVPAVRHQFGQVDLPVRLNIVGDKRVSNLELVEVIARLMNKTPKIEMVDYHANNPGHDLHYGLDGTALANLGWKSPIPFEESLKRTIDWQLQNKNWMV